MWATFRPTVSSWGRRAETQRKSDCTINSGSGLKEQGGPETHPLPVDITAVQIPSFDKLFTDYLLRVHRGRGNGKKTDER